MEDRGTLFPDHSDLPVYKPLKVTSNTEPLVCNDDTFFSYYDDFVTIDWVRDRNRDRDRHKRLLVDRALSWRGWGTKVWDGLSGWLIVFLVGVSSGLLAGMCVRVCHVCACVCVGGGVLCVYTV